MVIAIIVTILTVSYFINFKTGKTITLILAILILSLGLLGWAHFRIEWMQLLKGKHVMSNEDIHFYEYDPKGKDAEFKARKRKILTFEVVIIILLVTTLLSGIPVLSY